MKGFRNFKVKNVALLPRSSEEESKILHYVLQPLFWYMRLCGLLVPVICNHNRRSVKDTDQVLEDSQRVQPEDLDLTRTKEVHSQEEIEDGNKPANVKTSLSQKTSTGLMKTGPELTSPGDYEGNLHSKCGHVGLFLVDKKSEHKSAGVTGHTIVCGNPIVADGLSDPGNAGRSDEEVSGCEKNKWARKTTIQRVKQKNYLVSKNSKASGDPNLITTGRAVHRLPDKCATKKSKQHSLQNVMHTETDDEFLVVAKLHRQTYLESNHKSCEESEEEELNQCPQCQIIFIWNRILCVTVCILLVCNCLRYATIFFQASFSTADLISAIIFQSFFFGITIAYIFTAYVMAKRLPQLLKDLQKFEDIYGTSLDLVCFKRRTLRRSRVCFALQLSFSTGFILFSQFVFPSLRRHLAPFHNAEGVTFYFVLISFAAVLNFIGSFIYFMQGFVGVTGYLLIQELNNASSDLHHVLANSGPVLGLSKGDIRLNQDGNISENSASLTSTRHCGTYGKRQSPEQHSMKNRKRSSTVVTVEDIAETENDSQIMLHNTGNGERIQDGCDIPHDVKETQCAQHESLLAQNNPTSHIVDNSFQNRNQTFADTFGNKKQTSNEDTSVEKNEGVLHQTVAQETSFDILRVKHQMLCELVAKTNVCVHYFVSTGFAGSIPLMCLIIFVLTSGFLDVANFLFLLHNLLYTVFYLVTVTWVGFSISDAAHGAQEVIYAADWSQLSDRLLTKVQLFATRLAHSQIGYDVYGLFVIDRSTVLMLVGTLITYTVVVLQFQQAETCDCETGGNTTVPP